ncbi:toll-like receptor 4 [Ylistrum balloti]|uniref:toll-like receptor 4 n=1 Tax=Ylistrum balloti TaxID=509963 RepID=UPI0029057E48|nr:toll-like receptor 4 [Ylistrum balloti]
MYSYMNMYQWILLMTLQFSYPIQGVYNVHSLSRILDNTKTQNNGHEMAVSSNCSSEVRCWCGEVGDIVVADCSSLNLTVIPEFQVTVNIIDLRYNQLLVINNTDQLPTNLLYLDLSNNGLTGSIDYPFKHLANLTHLDFSYNDLRYLPEVYPPNIFCGLHSLIFLNIKGNNKRGDLVQYHYPRPVATLLGLTSLRMDGLRNARLGDVLSPLKKLASLDLSGGSGQCSIDHMAEDFFDGVPSSLSDLDLSSCDILYIENGTFQSLPNLAVLSLTGNKHLTFHVLRNLTYDLQFTNIRTLYLNQLHCTYGIGTFIFKEDMIFLNNTRLKELHLDFNRIEMVEDTMLQYLPDSLEQLTVAGNKFTLGRYLIMMYLLKSLKKIDISLQAGQHGPVNEMLDQCFDWRGPKEANDHSHEYGGLELYTQGYPDVNVPENLEVIDGHSSSFRGAIGHFSFMKTNRLKYLDGHDNSLHTWKGPVRNLHRVEYMDLSDNSCEHVTANFFEDFPSMTTLNISNNILGEVFRNDTAGDLLKNLTNLKTLNISYNKIDRLSEAVFHGLAALEQIDLSFNQMTDWDVIIDHMHHLQLLNFSNNRLTVLPKSFMDAVDRLIKITDLTLDLRGNPLRCSCAGLDFLKWVDRRRGNFFNLTTYNCRITDETEMSFVHLEDIISKLDKECSNYVGVIVGTSSLIMICVSIVISGLLYRFRWKIRYLYYMARNRYKGYDVIRDRSGYAESQYTYDAFVSYSDSDRSFVIQEILENLETQRGLRLCLHQRDFLPGNEIAVNITNAINNSRKTVAIITNSYLDSYWCMFEFNMARMESVYTRAEENVLFLILHEKISRRQIPMDVLDVIDSDSYIEYPDDEEGNVVFWNKLEEAISR